METSIEAVAIRFLEPLSYYTLETDHTCVAYFRGAVLGMLQRADGVRVNFQAGRAYMVGRR